MTARDLQRLFEEARGLGEEAQKDVLGRVRAQDASAANELEALLAAARMLDGGIPASSTSPGVRAAPPGGDDVAGVDFAATLLARLEERQAQADRYALREEVGRGGQGAVLRVWDEDLRRDLAMKIIREDPLGGMRGLDWKTLSRFLKEAQVTSQLDHPGIVPVHELGLDSQGRVYFTMKLVKGRDFSAILELVRRGAEGWSRTRALGVLLKVCDAMAYAHSKGVIHRDLKPQNVMVGSYGEVYVMDWGIARVHGHASSRDVRIKPLASPDAFDDGFEGEQALDSPLVTMDGDIVGTPTYMSPEQALGTPEAMGPHSDVYSAGAMLYELLSGRKPYVEPGKRVNDVAIWNRLRQGPPESLHRIAPDAPAELIAICEKAMAREPAERYRDMSELGDDLRAFLEDRVVRAYEAGAFAELRKWIRRNQPLALAILAVVAVTVGGLVKATIDQAAKARRAAEEAERGRQVFRLSAFRAVTDLQQRARGLWPAHPERIEAYEAWLRDARQALAGLAPDEATGDPGHRAQLAVLRARALPRDDARDGEPAAPRAWRFADGDDEWWHDQLTILIGELEALQDEATGLIAGVSEEYGWGIERRLAFARTIGERSVSGPEARRRWADARAAIARHAAYGGLDLAPQMGLLPLGPDTDSGLWEFWHLQSGDEPQRDEHGRIRVDAQMGIVLVLLPPGRFWMGAQCADPNGRNYDPQADVDESPVHEVTLPARFLSKYELTQGQWERFTGTNPSSYDANKHAEKPQDAFGRPFDLAYPVDNVSWLSAFEVTLQMGLVLPTEGLWEYGARAGTSTRWWCGDRPEDLADVANLADAFAAENTSTWVCEPWSDGYTYQARVGSLPPNAFGLYEVSGNMMEWCLGPYVFQLSEDGRARTDVFELPDPATIEFVVGRGGDFNDPASVLRASHRGSDRPTYRSQRCGVRPARLVDPR